MELIEKYGFSLERSGRGDVTIFNFEAKTKKIKQQISTHNLILYSGADILAQCLAGTPGYKIAAMYIEYQNLASPTDPVVVPAFDRTGGIEYYNALGSSPNGDFLRVPLVTNPTVSSSNMTDYAGNVMSFFAMSEGTAGFFGRPFNASSNSAVLGAALVATPDPDSQAEDVVFSRVYAGIGKVLVATGFNVGVVWGIQFS